MADLAAEAALAGLPLRRAGVTVTALPPVLRVSVAPFSGRQEAVAAALGMPLPAPGRCTQAIVWAGLGQWLVVGREAGELARRLHGLAAVTDQSDAWIGLGIAGDEAAEALARLVPLDLAGLAAGTAARTLLRHVPLLVVVVPAGFDLYVPRSYARTALHEIAEALRSLAGRAALSDPAA